MITLILTVIVIAKGMNQNYWIWGGILTFVTSIELFLGFLIIVESSSPGPLFFAAVAIAFVIRYFLLVFIFALLNSWELDSQLIYVLIFFCVQFVVALILNAVLTGVISMVLNVWWNSRY